MRGSIIRRGPKSWAVVVYLGRDPHTGRERHKWYSFATKREAERTQAKLVTHLNEGGVLPPSTKLHVREYLADWLRGHAPQVAPTTFASYRDTIRKHLAPAFGDLPLAKLHPQAVRDYIATKLAVGLSPKTVAYHRTILRRALEQAVRDGLIVRNVAALVKAPPKRRREMTTLDTEQVRLFLGEAKRTSAYYRLYLAAVLTGARQGELLGLRWKDCDLTLWRAAIAQTFYRLGGSKRDGIKAQQLFKAPKTPTSRRSVPLPTELVSELLGLREEQEAQRRMLGERYTDHGLVFCQPNGKPLHAHNVVRRDFHKVLALEGLRAELRERGIPEEALPKGLPRIRFHDLRHTTATLHLARGVHPKVVAGLLGHASVQITLDTYSHVIPALEEDATHQLATLLVASPEEERTAFSTR